METKTSTFTGEKLAYWTARAQGWNLEYLDRGVEVWKKGMFCVLKTSYRPDINAGQAMELARKFGLIVNFEIGEVWKCGRTYPIGEDYSAICRAAVDFVFGEEVDDEIY